MQKSNLFIYLIYIFLCFIIFLIDSYVGLVLVVFSYLLLFFLNLKKNGSILNFLSINIVTKNIIGTNKYPVLLNIIDV